MSVAGHPAVNYQYDQNTRLIEIESLINGVSADFNLRHGVHKSTQECRTYTFHCLLLSTRGYQKIY